MKKIKQHLQNKTVSKKLKEQEKVQAQNDSKVNVACFDLQQVLTTPHTMSLQLYYKRKLATYNLTVFDVGKSRCYMWHEKLAKRRANQIASCVWKYIIDKVENKHCREFVLFTDNCGGQNKNKTIAEIYMHAIKNLPIQRISH